MISIVIPATHIRSQETSFVKSFSPIFLCQSRMLFMIFILFLSLKFSITSYTFADLKAL